jgi:hypothetical protein
MNLPSSSLPLANQHYLELDNSDPIDLQPLATRLEAARSAVLAQQEAQRDVERQEYQSRLAELSAVFEEAFIRHFGINLWSDCTKAGAKYLLFSETDVVSWVIPIPDGDGSTQLFYLFYSKHFDGTASSDTPWTYSTEFEMKKRSTTISCGLHTVRLGTETLWRKQLINAMVKVQLKHDF